MRSVDLEVPGTRQLSCVVPAGWEWMAKFFQTVFRDATKRPMTIVDTYATGVSVSQQFLIASLSHPIEAKGVLKMEVDLTPYGAAPRRASRSGLGPAHAANVFTLPDKLSELAGGVKIVTCRYLGGGQIERIQTCAVGAGDGAHGEGRQRVP